MHGHDWPGWGGMNWLFWFLIAVVLLALVAWPAGPRRLLRNSDESPETILKRRYARGEIGKEQYENMLQDLRR
jgi:putative membrane protein